MAHRALAPALALVGIFAVSFSPLLALVIFGAALVVVLDRRGVVGAGRFRAIIAFVAAPWIGIAGVVLAVLGSVSGPGSFFLAPGVVLLGGALAMLAWSSVALWRLRGPGRRPEFDG